MVGAGVRVCRAHMVREAVALSLHLEEDRQEEQKMWWVRRLLERRTPEVGEEVGMWNVPQARNRIEENPGVVL